MAATMTEKIQDSHVEAIAKEPVCDIAHTGKIELDHERARELAVTFDPNSPENKALVRKLDWRLVPCTWTLYLLSNIGM